MRKKIFILKYTSLFAAAGFSTCLITGAIKPAYAQQVQSPADQFAKFGQMLADKGITFNSGYVGNWAYNPTGGTKTGGAYAYQFSFGTDLNLGKIIGLKGGYIHAVYSDRDGQNLSLKTINNSVTPQQIYGGGETYHLTVLTYEQKLFADRVNILLGRSTLARYALYDPIYSHFMSNGIDGNPPILAKNTNISSTQVPVWMGMVTIKPTENTYVKFGAEENNPVSTKLPHHGFDFSFAHENGAIGWGELGYQTTFATSDYPSHYDIGVAIDRSPYSYTLYSAATKTLKSGEAYGRSMPYIQFQQMVYRPSLHSHAGLTLFGLASFGPSHLQTVNYNIVGGASYQGAIPSRPNDFIDIMVSNTNYRGRYLNQYYQYRVNVQGSSQQPYHSLIMTEINYDAKVTPWMDVMPNFQYIIHPDGLGFHGYPSHNVKNALVFGLYFNINIASFLGLPAAS